MELTKEYLVDLREKAVAKRQEYLNMIHQADGAIGVLDMLIAQISKESESTNADDAI
jgi:hypothetical protein